MIAASTYLPSTSSSTIAASSIHGTGAQNFSSAMRNGCTLVSGIAFGPNFSSRRRASSLVRPFGRSSFAPQPIWRASRLHRDRFAYPKTSSRRDVMERLPARLQTQPWCGRLADVQEFEHLAFARDRFLAVFRQTSWPARRPRR